MPIYEYICDKCGQAFEVLLASAASTSDCPECGSTELSRQLSTFAARGGGDACRNADACPVSRAGCPSGGICPGVR
ncbi:MAG: zinc ribbon domain-containing protein [Planctomycetes bacterium]|jgi:putative FmdB family regulatory protein|nr:zinc ribbon domain-containing protein [Planctomycetota bacterium]